jgi:hypothetical protein
MLSDGEYPIFLNDEQLAKISKEDLVNNYKQLQNCIETLNTKRQQNEKEKLFEIAKLKNLILMKYVSSKEQESTVILNSYFLVFQTVLKVISLLESISGNAKIKASSAAIESIC